MDTHGHIRSQTGGTCISGQNKASRSHAYNTVVLIHIYETRAVEKDGREQDTEKGRRSEATYISDKVEDRVRG